MLLPCVVALSAIVIVGSVGDADDLTFLNIRKVKEQLKKRESLMFNY